MDEVKEYIENVNAGIIDLVYLMVQYVSKNTCMLTEEDFKDP